MPAPRTYGNAPKSPIPWPGTHNVDMTLMKSFRMFKLSEDVKFDLRADFFNLFNWVNWKNTRYGPNTQKPAQYYTMKYYWTEAPRTIQVSGRITW